MSSNESDISKWFYCFLETQNNPVILYGVLRDFFEIEYQCLGKIDILPESSVYFSSFMANQISYVRKFEVLV